MKRKKKASAQPPEERTEQGLRPEGQPQPQDRSERIEAELASKHPGAAGLTVRSTRPKC
jgi:hypothetical protein